MKRHSILWTSLLLIAAFSACTVAVNNNVSASSMAKKHPDLSAQEKLIQCSSCHKDVTPGIYKQWYESVHGIANVKCFQCHGTYEDFAVTPQESTCAACHNKQFSKKPSDKSCWDCHPAHHFSIHK